MSMNYAVRRIGDVTILDLSGRISLGEALAFGAGNVVVLHEVVRNLARTGARKLVLNLENVTYVDSSGIGELVTCMTTIRNQGGELKVCSAGKQVCDVLRSTRLAPVLDLEEDEAAALSGFRRDWQKGTTAA